MSVSRSNGSQYHYQNTSQSSSRVPASGVNETSLLLPRASSGTNRKTSHTEIEKPSSESIVKNLLDRGLSNADDLNAMINAAAKRSIFKRTPRDIVVKILIQIREELVREELDGRNRDKACEAFGSIKRCIDQFFLKEKLSQDAVNTISPSCSSSGLVLPGRRETFSDLIEDVNRLVRAENNHRERVGESRRRKREQFESFMSGGSRPTVGSDLPPPYSPYPSSRR
jgi:hypothetical protein